MPGVEDRLIPAERPGMLADEPRIAWALLARGEDYVAA
jgi:hypothetical protein